MINFFPHRIFHVRFFIISCLLVACAHPKATVQKQPETLDPMQVFEHKLELMRKAYNIPGMSVAVLREQKIVLISSEEKGESTVKGFTLLY